MFLKYNKRNVLVVGDRHIIPGVNTVPTEAWQDIQKNHPRVQQMLETKELEVAEGEGDFEDSGASFTSDEDLSRLNERQAQKLVRNTYDTGTLRIWSDLENRESVKSVINDQLRQIEDTEPKKKSGK